VAAPFENLTVFSYSVIVGEIVDQAQLHGVLNWLGERGIPIVSVSPMDSSPERGNLGG
jgi:hypothetical protein